MEIGVIWRRWQAFLSNFRLFLIVLKSPEMNTEEDASLNVLPGTTGKERGGLVVKKKHHQQHHRGGGDDREDDREVFKKPNSLGLEKLARAKREENLRKRRHDEGEETLGLSDSTRREISRYVEEKYRDDRRDRRGVVGDVRRDRRDRDYDNRDRDRNGRNGDERRSFREAETPKFLVPNTPSSSQWEEDGVDRRGGRGRSSWDRDTPRQARDEGDGWDSTRSWGSAIQRVSRLGSNNQSTFANTEPTLHPIFRTAQADAHQGDTTTSTERRRVASTN